MSTAPLAANRGTTDVLSSRRTIPFDYSFHFELNGKLGKSYTQTLTVSIEAAFTAVSIGYGVIPHVEIISFGPEQLDDLDAVAATTGGSSAALPRVLPDFPMTVVLPRRVLINLPNAEALSAGRNQLLQDLGNTISTAVSSYGAGTSLAQLDPDSRAALIGSPRQIGVGDLIRSLARKLGEESFTNLGQIGPKTQFALLNGIRLNPEGAKVFLTSGGSATLDARQIARLFETIGAQPERVLFLYALRDEGSGREFQSDYVLNTAGLGISDGERPFRYFAVPITFAARSTIRLDIVAKSDFAGGLFVSLHGYKVLGASGTPTGHALRGRSQGRPRA